jgi:hypothetical protein
VLAVGSPANWTKHYEQAPLVRDQKLVAHGADLRLAFLTNPDDPPRLMTLATATQIPVRRVVP